MSVCLYVLYLSSVYTCMCFLVCLCVCVRNIHVWERILKFIRPIYILQLKNMSWDDSTKPKQGYQFSVYCYMASTSQIWYQLRAVTRNFNKFLHFLDCMVGQIIAYWLFSLRKHPCFAMMMTTSSFYWWQLHLARTNLTDMINHTKLKENPRMKVLSCGPRFPRPNIPRY